MKRLLTVAAATLAVTALSAHAADAKAKVQAEMKDAAAFKAIKEGVKDKDGKALMKPAENLSDDDIKALVAFMRTFKK